MRKKSILICLAIAMLLPLFTTFSLAANITQENVTIEKVKDNVCTIELGKDGKLTKKLLSLDNEKKELTLQIDVENLKNQEEKLKPTEMFLVLDNSKSMQENKLSDGRTRKEAVFTAAKVLVESILKEQPTTKIGLVSFSSNSQVEKEGTLEDAVLIANPTSNITDLKTAIDGIETTGARTNIDAGLQTAKNAFSKEAGVNRHVILLTDGVPNNSVGTKLTYSGTTRDNTKKTLQSIIDSNINIITVMTGVDSTYKPDPDGNLNPDAAGKTYKDLAEEIFGTIEKPNYGKFYYVSDEAVENTITKDVYNDVKIVIKNELKDIVVVDYFPLDIVENYDFEIFEAANIGEVTPTINKENNSITWNIKTLKAGEKATFKYKLKLKPTFNEKLIDLETPTNQKVDVDYTGTDDLPKKETSNVSPSVILRKEEDKTIAPEPIPQSGDNVGFIIILTTILGVIATIYVKKYTK